MEIAKTQTPLGGRAIREGGGECPTDVRNGASHGRARGVSITSSTRRIAGNGQCACPGKLPSWNMTPEGQNLNFAAVSAY